MQFIEQSYCELVRKILNNGEFRDTRNAKTISLFGETLVSYELENDSFPILEGRKLYYEGVLGELKTFLEGPRDLQHFKDNGCNYWDKFADEDGKLDLAYGNEWLNFNLDDIDQIEKLYRGLKEDPNGRRHIVTGWNPNDLSEVPPCHILYQWYVTNDKRLEMIWYQRSVDVMIGLPSDIILAAAWNIKIAHDLGFKPGKITFNLGDTHIYQNHIAGAIKYLQQVEKITPFNEVNYSYDSQYGLEVKNYNPQKHINFEVFV